VIPIFKSLQHRNFKLYYFGQLISLNGAWMQNVAQAWLVYRLTESSFMLGLTAFCALFPVLLLSLWGGVLADHINRHKLLVFAYSAGLAQALTLGLLTLTGHVQVWHILVLSALLGIIHALEMPARHSFLSDIVSRENLPNAIALNSSAFNIARFSGPFIAGILVANIGEGPVFIINALTFLAVIYNLLSMQLPSFQTVRTKGSVLVKMREGLGFAWSSQSIRISLMLLSVFSIVGTSLTVLMPVFTRSTFHGDSGVLGILLGTMGAGALIGALTLAYLSRNQGLQWYIGAAGLVAGLCLVVFSMTSEFMLAIPVLILFGFCQTILAASTNTLIQSQVSDVLRGRVMSIFSTVFIGFMPIGSISSGFIADRIGVNNTVYILGTISMLASIAFLINNRARSQREKTDMHESHE
jgi:MFS family permease